MRVAKACFSNDEPKKAAAQPFRRSVIVKKQRNPTLRGSVSQLPSQLVAPVLREVDSSKKQKYPILHEDVEDAWLNGQEASLARCVNNLFQTMDNGKRELGHGHLRQILLDIHQGAECSLLHRRLKASLLYGCLGRPKNSSNAPSLKSDIGIRRKFNNLWADNYSLDILSVAAEVVIGREAVVDSSIPRSKHQCDDAIYRKKLEILLNSYLLRNEDVPDSEQPISAWCWRRTMLRSMMMIYLLDKAKQMHIISANLYQASSTIKSSLAFLRELAALIHPSAGDIYRLLKPLDYYVHHTQYPLAEYSYSIDNLATDLRDGVRLAHLVELLLYPPGSRTTVEENVTIAMSTGELSTAPTITLEEGHSGVLSQRLKFPCAARAQMIHNVQVALSALYAVHGVGQVAKDINAEEIVDGHREKTMNLLWALLGKR